jgi:hydrogenase nickel incorporation protein HypA/HybF
MHELSLARALLDEAERIRRAHGAGRVLALQVDVGEMSGVEPESLRSALELLAESGNSSSSCRLGARPGLELRLVPVEASCAACGTRGRVVRFQFRCPGCGATRLTVLGGAELILRGLTLETTEAECD